MAWRDYVGGLVRPILRSIPFGKAPIYGAFVGGPSPSSGANGTVRPWRLMFDRTIDAYALCDLDDGLGRQHYYYGSYTPDLNRLIIKDQLGPGDTFIDVGAHKGVFTLCASRVVGPQGKVFAVEPNLDSYRIVGALLTLNGIRNCSLFNCGLSDEEGTLLLSRPEGRGEDFCTFRKLEGERKSELTVPVHRADAILGDLKTSGRILAKVDTEGFEHHVLRGFGQLLDLENISFVVEVTDEWLRQTGSGAAQLFQLMVDHGFAAYEPIRKRGLKVTLDWARVDAPPAEFQTDLFFTKRPPR